ncbi:MAG: hypothetical protein ACRDD7_06315 [Peptostreptococcaceae bacterium]
MDINRVNFGIVGNSFIMDSGITDECVCLYVALRMYNYNAIYNCSLCSLKTIYNLLGVNEKQSRHTKVIKDSLSWLVENDYIAIYDDLGMNEVSVDDMLNGMFYVEFITELDLQHNGGFTIITQSNMSKVLDYIRDNIVKGFKKYMFMRYYLIICRQCSNDNKFGSITQSRLNGLLSIHKTTCKIYNDTLEELGLIYYTSGYGSVDMNGVFRNTYTLFGCRGINIDTHKLDEMTECFFDSCVSYEISKNGLQEIDTERINNKRSESMKKIWEERKKNNI